MSRFTHEMTQPAGSLLFRVDGEDELVPLAPQSSTAAKDVDSSSDSDTEEHDRASSTRFPPPRSRQGSGATSASFGSAAAAAAAAAAHAQGVHLATMAQKRALWWRNVLVTGMFILSWYTFATLLSLYNKWMFSAEYYGFTYPLFVSACHMVIQFLLALVIRILFARRFRPAERPSRRDYATRIVPTAWATGTDIGLSNLSLKTITLSLYTMCKSSALIFVLMFAFMFRLEKYSIRLVSVILLISFGVFCMVFNATEVSIPGIIMVFSASAVGGLRWALTEVIMHKRAMGMSNPFATIFWLSPIMGVFLFVVSLAVESWHDMFTSHFFGSPLEALKTVAIIVLPGALAFSMVASEYFIIQRAGVVPLSIAGIFKEVSTITFAAWVFGDQLTELNIIGVVITISGIALYSYHKYQRSIHREVRLDAAQNPIDDPDDESAPLRPGAAPHGYSRTATTDEHDRSRRMSASSEDGGDRPTLSPMAGQSALQLHSLHSAVSSESREERTTRLRDEFEGWNNGDTEDEDDESEADEEEIARRRSDRVGGDDDSRSRSKWNEFWDRSM